MNNLNDSLPDLMRRVTDDLEPESPDLVDRGIRRGVTLRRRRKALLSLSGAAAVLATAGVTVGGTQLFAGTPQAPVAGSTTAAPTQRPAAPKPATPAGTLATLQSLLPETLQQSSPKSGADGGGMHRAEVVVNDGRGASLIRVSIITTKVLSTCAGLHGTCKVLPDGSVFTSYANESITRDRPDKNPWGIKNTVVELFRPDGRMISIYSYNAPRVGVQHTRPNPLFSVAQLTAMATSSEWTFPAKAPEPDLGPQPGDGKPTVPLSQTQQTLRNVLPRNLQLTRPETWGGGGDGFNGASYVVNDGRGAARVDVFVQYETPRTKCGDEGPSHCQVRPDGAVTGWSRNEPTYGDERQAINGVLANRVEIHYPDGRMISMTSYNGPQEKDAKHTRVKPVLSTAELFAMAGNAGWKFPGTGK
ncbi:hypothetical protein BWI15_06790 [Kribbella sp. ALI-6-A]|uniref:hypothetical protein n=1 Tax=Kribbella sp. ALI-6-A TaxID=1933817 RepID=UPI00097C21D1|nr:hypothetical protein [Kribbella sp. ALI-6-A]ONI75549.1 hypothetical protein BWI15_06790 [Kribbella sp. ALI-6-A]